MLVLWTCFKSTSIFFCGLVIQQSAGNLLKAEPFLLWRWVGTNGSPKERWTTDYMSTVSAEVPVILLFLARSSKKFEKRSCSSKTWIFLKQSITWPRDFLIFFISYFILSENNNSVKTISISGDNDLSPLGNVFSHVVICLFNTLTSIKTDCSRRNTTEKTEMSHFLAIYC